MYRLKTALFIALFAFLALAHACTREPKLFLVGTNVWPGYEPLYLARELGYLKPSVRLVEFVSASEVIRSFRNGTLDGAAVTLDEVELLLEAGVDLRLLFVMDFSKGADALVANPRFGSVKSLKGRRVGVENTALGAYMITRALQLAGIGPKEIRVVPLEISEQERAFKEGVVDAVVTFDPVRTRLIEDGARVLFDSSQIPGEIVDVFVVRKSYLDQNPKQVEAFEGAWFSALDYFARNPEESAKIFSGRLHLSPRDVKESLKALHFPSHEEGEKLLQLPNPPLLETAKKLADLMYESHLLRRPVDPSPLFQRDYGGKR